MKVKQTILVTSLLVTGVLAISSAFAESQLDPKLPNVYSDLQTDNQSCVHAVGGSEWIYVFTPGPKCDPSVYTLDFDVYHNDGPVQLEGTNLPSGGVAINTMASAVIYPFPGKAPEAWGVTFYCGTPQDGGKYAWHRVGGTKYRCE